MPTKYVFGNARATRRRPWCDLRTWPTSRARVSCARTRRSLGFMRIAGVTFDERPPTGAAGGAAAAQAPTVAACRGLPTLPLAPRRRRRGARPARPLWRSAVRPRTSGRGPRVVALEAPRCPASREPPSARLALNAGGSRRRRGASCRPRHRGRLSRLRGPGVIGRADRGFATRDGHLGGRRPLPHGILVSSTPCSCGAPPVSRPEPATPGRTRSRLTVIFDAPGHGRVHDRRPR